MDKSRVAEISLHSGRAEVTVEVLIERFSFQSAPEGFPGSAVRDLVALIGNEEIFSRLLNVASGRIGADVEAEGIAPAKLSQSETGAVMEVIQIYLMALQLKQTPEDAREWLYTASDKLSGNLPLELLTVSEGRRWVSEVLHAALIEASEAVAEHRVPVGD